MTRVPARQAPAPVVAGFAARPGRESGRDSTFGQRTLSERQRSYQTTFLGCLPVGVSSGRREHRTAEPTGGFVHRPQGVVRPRRVGNRGGR